MQRFVYPVNFNLFLLLYSLPRLFCVTGTDATTVASPVSPAYYSSYLSTYGCSHGSTHCSPDTAAFCGKSTANSVLNTVRSKCLAFFHFLLMCLALMHRKKAEQG